MGKLAVKLGAHSQKVGKDLGKSELVLASASSSQPIPMSNADFESAISADSASAQFIQLESGGLIELEDGSGFFEREA